MPPANPHLQLQLASPFQADPPLPADPALRAIVDDVVARARLAILAAAAGEERVAPGPFDAAARNFVASRKPAARQRAAERARALLDASPALRRRELGRYAGLSLQEYLTVGSAGVAGRVSPLHVPAHELRVALEKHKPVLHLPQPPKKKPKLKFDPDVVEGLRYTKLRLFVRNVRCLEESDEVGSDEISLGAVVTNPNGDSFVGNRWNVSSDFDEDESVSYAGVGHKVCGWNLATDAAWPHVYGCILAMGERDDGGFADFLKFLWDQVKDDVLALVAAGLGAAIGGAIGNVLGAAIGACIGLLIGWLISLFDNQDEILGAPALTMTLASSRKSYYDWAKLTTAGGFEQTLHYRGDDSHYSVAVAYRVFAE